MISNGKTIFAFLLISFAAINAFAQVTDTLVLTWNDEFDGNTLDANKWAACPEWHRQGGSYWEADNAWLDGNGNLKLRVDERNDSVFCGAVRTHNKYNQKYGYFEVRCRVPQMQGGWAAFWMMPYGNQVGSQGNDGTELDIFESINGWNGKIQHALHWDGYGADHQKDSKSMTNWGLYDGEFHKFGMMWTPDEYIFYIDDVETWRSSAGGVSDVEQYMKLTLEVSGDTWAGNWANQTNKPITWAVDYVRTYAYAVKKPAIEFIVPDNNVSVSIGNTQGLKAFVNGNYDYLTTVEFYAQKDGGTEELIQIRNIGANSDSLFYAAWNPIEIGNYTITVRGKKDGEVITTTEINATVVNDISTWIEELSTEISIFPNPGNNKVNFSSMVGKVEVFDATGLKVLESSNVSSLDISSLKSGNYFVFIDNKSMNKLLVK